MFIFRWYIVVILLIWLLVSWFIAEEFQRIAAIKGFYEPRYFWCSFLLGPIGWLMVIALPDRGYNPFEGGQKPEDQHSEDDTPDNSQ